MDFKNNHRILIVDDFPSIHQDFRKILVPEENLNLNELNEMESLLAINKGEQNLLPPFELEFALQSAEAVNLVRKALLTNSPYAVAFIDVQMPPGEDGVETISRIWEIDKEIQTVICTAYTKYSWEDIRKKLGETDRLFILKKPFDNLEIIQLACTLCKTWNYNHLNSKNLNLISSQASHIPSSNKTMDRLNDAMNLLSKLNQNTKEPKKE